MKRRSPLTRKSPLRPGGELRRTALARKPGTALKRTGPPKAKKPLRRVNPERRAAEFARCYGSEARVAFVRSLPSVATGRRPCVNAHVGTGGTGRKADARHIVPLTWDEHEEMHRVGEAAFAARYSLDLTRAAAATEAAWQRHRNAA